MVSVELAWTAVTVGVHGIIVVRVVEVATAEAALMPERVVAAVVLATQMTSFLSATMTVAKMGVATVSSAAVVVLKQVSEAVNIVSEKVEV